MAKATTIKEAIKKWEEKTGLQAATATEVSLIFQWPPIEKMDNTLSCLANCEKLSLSTNMIEKVTGLNSLKKLRILSLGRNYIKSFSGMMAALPMSGGLENMAARHQSCRPLLTEPPPTVERSVIQYFVFNLLALQQHTNSTLATVPVLLAKECLADTLEELWISYNLIEKMKGVGALRNLRVLYMSNNLVKEWSEFNKLQELQYLEDLLFVGNPLYDGCELEAWRAEVARRLPGLKKLDGETVLRDEPPLTVADMQVEADCGDAVETLVSAETNEV